MTTKICPGQGSQSAHTLSIDSFGDNQARPDGKAAYCLPCAAAIQREWKRNNRTKVLASKRKYRELEKAGA